MGLVSSWTPDFRIIYRYTKYLKESSVLDFDQRFFFNYFLKIAFVLKHGIFPSRVIDGLETLDELEKQPVQEKSFKPFSDIRIQNITVHANPLAG